MGTPRPYEWYGHTGSVVENGDWQPDYFSLSGPMGDTQIKVLCTGNGGYEWNSWGQWSDTANDALAQYWCEEY